MPSIFLAEKVQKTIDIVLSKPGVNLLVITGLALAILGAMVLVGMYCPAGHLGILAATFKHYGAYLMLAGGLTIVVATILAKYLAVRAAHRKCVGNVLPKPSAEEGDSQDTKVGKKNKPEDNKGEEQDDKNVNEEPLPFVPRTGPTGSKGNQVGAASGRRDDNVRFTDEK